MVNPGWRTWNVESPNVRAIRTSTVDSIAVTAVAPANRATSRPVISTAEGDAEGEVLGRPAEERLVAVDREVADAERHQQECRGEEHARDLTLGASCLLREHVLRTLQVLRHAPCPVLVASPAGKADSHRVAAAEHAAAVR